MTEIIPVEAITDKIFDIRGQRIMVDADLAKLYGVATKVLNQAVKRNRGRFPEDFMFQLTKEERNELVTICDRLTNLKHSSAMPYVFTENGVAMLSSVLNSEKAIQINLQIIRAFVRLRNMLLENDALRYAIEGLEKRMSKNERDIQLALTVIQQVLMPKKYPKPKKPKYKIGFAPPEKKKRK
jgi:phage regulator Rha-like protein